MRVIVTIFVLAGLTNAARAGCAGTTDADPLASAMEQGRSTGAAALHVKSGIHTPP